LLKSEKEPGENGQLKKPGLWFIFQDLSVRSEGMGRLKFTFFNLKDTLAPDHSTDVSSRKIAPLLACTYSSPFKVHSAKKFPGVVSTTDLSRIFAEQGVKIPIRKNDGEGESGGKRKRKGSVDEDEGSGDDGAE
jgi:hypothetical protein